MTAQEVIARELCRLSEIETDETNLTDMQAFAACLVSALFEAGYDIVISADADEEVED
jgi:hypothetical protein